MRENILQSLQNKLEGVLSSLGDFWRQVERHNFGSISLLISKLIFTMGEGL